MEEIYRKLREKYDQLGFGYPSSESGKEYTMLKYFFSPEDAEYFISMDYGYVTPAEFAAKTGRDVNVVAEKLEDMSKRGILFRVRKENEVKYHLAPIAHGLYEFNVNRIEPEWYFDFMQLLGTDLGPRAYGTDTPLFRTIPVRKEIVSENRVLPFDDADEILKSKKIFAVGDCACRKGAQVVGNPCGHPIETCLAFDDFAEYYIENGIGREISYEEAVDVVKSGEKDGRIIQIANSKEVELMCSCCSCGCGIMQLMKAFPGPANDVVSNYVCEKDESLCNKVCAKICTEKCPTGAQQMVDGEVYFDQEKCIGCGLCVYSCPKKALSLVSKEEAKVYEPRETLFDAYEDMADYRKK